MIALSLSFFITALLYASVGFGGGSTYNALLVLAEVDYRILPSIALLCNLIVVSGGSYRFLKSGHVKYKRILPWVVTSVPAAWLGGYLNISETLFVGLLGFSLLLAGFRMFWIKEDALQKCNIVIRKSKYLYLSIGGVLGLLAGVVGIGGGIFLAPLLYLLNWGKAKEIAGTCSVFILVNSVAGLCGQVTKYGTADLLDNINIYWMLFVAVLIGGQIGSYMGALKLDPKIVRLMTGVLILYVSIRLLFRWYGMVS